MNVFTLSVVKSFVNALFFQAVTERLEKFQRKDIFEILCLVKWRLLHLFINKRCVINIHRFVIIRAMHSFVII